nr:MAG TPA: hypothetical protein [Caudoviricetes sp.]
MPSTNIATEIARIQTDRNTIRTKLVALGLATAAASLDACATAIEGIENRGAVNASVTEGSTYTIPKGYHNGSGTVAGVAGGGNYTLQTKSITPTKKEQNVTSDDGYYGLSSVTVAAIPEAYQDVSSTTAAAENVLAGKIFVAADGTVTTGTMANNGTISKTLDATTTSYTVPAGYHSGSGKVSITTETKEVTPTESAQDVTPTAGKVLSKVSVARIPTKYADATGMTATATGMLADTTAIGWDAEKSAPVKLTGTMADNGSTSATIDGLTQTSVTIPAGYTSGGAVSLTDDIYDALAAI